ncbi:MAG: hypothetical protein VX740_04155, partial [Pseudomonadota bacterium]|nr:hypothetical protein [Pseudomonadota bacterium]
LYSSSNNTVYVVGNGLDAVRDAGAGGVLWVQNGDINNTTYYQADNGSLIIESGSAVIVAVDHFNGAGISGISFDNGANVYTIPTDGIQFYQDEYDNSFQSTSGDDVYYADEHNDAYISSTRGDNVFHFTQSVSATTTINSYGIFAHSETLVLDGVTSTDEVQLIRYSDRPNEIVVKFGADGQIILQGEDFVSQTQIEIDGQSYALSAFDFITQGTPDTDNYYRSNQTLNIEGDFSGFSIDDVMYGGFGDDGMLGHDGNDTLYGEGGMDSIVGGNGNDTIDGGDDDDTIDGNAGSDLYLDSHGNDTYYMSTGDTLVAGSGENTVLTSDTDLSGALIDLSQYGYVLEDNTVILGFVRDVSGFLNDDYVIHYAGNEITLDNYDEYTLAPTIKLADDSTASLSSLAVEGIGSDNLDFFNEGNFNITLNDILYMGDGDDGIILTAGDDTVYGQGGGDTITKEGGTGALIAYGGEGNDIITDGTGDDIIDAGADNDYVFAYYGGNDTIDAGAGDDTVNIALLGSGAVDGGEGTDIFSLIHLPTYNQTISFTEIDLDAGEVTTSLGTYTIANFETIYTAN